MESASIIKRDSKGKEHVSRAKSKIKGLIMNDSFEKLATTYGVTTLDIKANRELREAAVSEGLDRIANLDKEAVENQHIHLDMDLDRQL